jgi:hypothetical protein
VPKPVHCHTTTGWLLQAILVAAIKAYGITEVGPVDGPLLTA